MIQAYRTAQERAREESKKMQERADAFRKSGDHAAASLIEKDIAGLLRYHLGRAREELGLKNYDNRG